MKVRPLFLCALGLVAGTPYAADPPPAPRTTLQSGVETQYFDAAVKPADDFYQHVNGKWLATTEIPPDKPGWGNFYILHDEAQERLRGIIDEAAASGTTPASEEARKVGDLYKSFMDEPRLETLGLKPLDSVFAMIDTVKDKSELPALIAKLQQIGVTTPFDIDIDQDKRNSTAYVVYLSQSGLGLPDRDYYVQDDDAKLVGIRKKYGEHIERMLAMAGDKTAKQDAADILALETRDRARALDQGRVARSGEDLRQGRDEGSCGDRPRLRLARLPRRRGRYPEDLGRHPLPVELHQGFRCAVREDAAARCGRRTSSGRRCATTLASSTRSMSTSDSRSTAPCCRGPRRIARAGSAASRSSMIRSARRSAASTSRSISRRRTRCAWRSSSPTCCSPTSRHRRSRLDGTRPPRRKRKRSSRRSSLRSATRTSGATTRSSPIAPDDLVGNVMRARRFEYDRQVAKLGKPIDRSEWLMTPQTVNAYYNPQMNEIVFPAAILQPPFFERRGR